MCQRSLCCLSCLAAAVEIDPVGKSGVGVQMSPGEPVVPITSSCVLMLGNSDCSTNYVF